MGPKLSLFFFFSIKSRFQAGVSHIFMLASTVRGRKFVDEGLLALFLRITTPPEAGGVLGSDWLSK